MRFAYCSLPAFKAKAALLASLLDLKRQQSLERLARISGYDSYHEASHADLAAGGVPTLAQVAAQLAAVMPLDPTRALQVAEAMRLHVGPGTASATGDAGTRERFDRLYQPPFRVSRRALAQFEVMRRAKADPDRYPPLEPAAQAKAQQAWHASAFYLRAVPPVAAQPDLPAYPDMPPDLLSCCGDAESDATVADYLVEAWV